MANGIKEFIDTKNPVTVGIIAVLVIAVVAAIFGIGISGYATSTSEVRFGADASRGEIPILPIVVSEFAHDGWGDCDPTTMDNAKVDLICKKLGYAGIAADKPCLHNEKASTRYFWDGTIPYMGDENLYIKTTAGTALVGVLCV